MKAAALPVSARQSRLPPVAADVQEGADLAGAVADHEHRVLAHVGGEKVAGVGDLRLVAEEEPAAGKDLLQLLLVDFLVAEDAGVDDTVVGVDQGGHRCQCHGNLLAWWGCVLMVVGALLASGFPPARELPMALRPRLSMKMGVRPHPNPLPPGEGISL